MGILQQSSGGIVEQKPIIILYSAGGLGKTTLVSEAPKPYLMQIEEGSGNVDVMRSPKLETFEQAVATVDELIVEKHDYETLGIDTLDALELLLFKKICREGGNVKSMVEACGGYGNGYKRAVELWADFQAKLTELRKRRGMRIIALAHEIVSTYNDPTTTGGYDRYSIKLHESAKVSSARLWFDFADIVLFGKREVLQTSDKKRAVDANANEHVMFSQGRAAFDAKNRYGLPFKMPLRWRDFEAAMKGGKARTAKELKASIESLSAEIKDEALIGKIKANVKEVGNDLIDLKAIEERIIEILSNQG